MTETAEHETRRLLLAARLSRKVGKYQGIGIETQDQYGREWAERQHDFKTVHGTYKNVEVIDVAADVKSGRVPPWRRPKLKPWVTRPDKMQQYDGILAYKNDRLSRGDWDDETEIRQWASKHGKVLVIVDGPQWPPRDDGDFWAWTAQAKQAEKEWLEIQERNLRQQRELRERGKLVGRCPWGYVAVGEKYDKTIAPTDEGHRYVLQIFQHIADGDSLMAVAKWLDSQGAEPKYGGSWSPKSVANIIRNRTYMGTHLDLKGRTLLTVEPLVDAELWMRANKRLDNAPVGRRKPVSGKSALLTSCLFCPRCPRDGKRAPMYRTPSRNRGLHYRCAGHLPQREGCGNMVDLTVADYLATTMLSMAQEPWKDQRLIPGENHDIELADIKLEIRDLGAKELPDDEYDAELTRLRTERDRLAALPNVPDHWEDVETDETIGEHFTSLDYEGQRAMLLEDVKFTAESVTDPELLKIVLRMESRLFNVPVEAVAAERRADGQWRMLAMGVWREVPADFTPDRPMPGDESL